MSVIIGELREDSSTASRGQLNIEWMIPDFFSLSTVFYRSSNFFFMNRNWYLEINPGLPANCISDSDINYDDVSEWIVLCITAKNDFIPEKIKFTCSFGLKTAEGKKEGMFTRVYGFEKHIGLQLLNKLLLRSELLKRKSQLAPLGVVTFICTIKYDETDTVSRTDKLSKDLRRLMLSENTSDVTVSVQGGEFRLHRIILGVRTPVFSSVIEQEIKEKTTSMVFINDCEIVTFRDFVDYIYTGKLEGQSLKAMFGLYDLADKYQVKDLKESCVCCLMHMVYFHNIFDIMIFAQDHDENELLMLAKEFFTDNLKEIINTESWSEFLHKHTTQANKLLRYAVNH